MPARRPGIKSVAERANVGIATVSRVFTGSAQVNPERRARVLKAAAELGYQPNILAQSLRRGATMSAGFIADDLGDHLNTMIATGAESELRSRRFSLLVMSSEMEPSLDAENVRVLSSRRVDALMMAPVTEDDAGLVAALEDIDIPVVIVEGDLPGATSASFVVSDHRAGTAAALEDLLALGHRDIAVLTGPEMYRSARERAAATIDVGTGAGPGVRIWHEPTLLSPSGGEAATSRALARAERPTALVVGGDHLLTGVLGVIGAAGLVLGTDISVVTSDPVPLAGLFSPPLATITRDARGVGRQAAKILLRQLGDSDAEPERVMLPTVYERRPSVGPPPRR